MQKFDLLGREFRFRSFGQGQPLILLHGYGGSHIDWEDVGHSLGDEFEVYLPNLATHYLGLETPLSFIDLVDLIGAFLLEIKKRTGKTPLLAGTSFGAALAWGVTIRFPTVVDRLILVSPMPPNPNQRLRDPRMRFLLKLAQLPKAVGLFLGSPLGRLMIPYMENLFQLPWVRGTKHRRWALLTHRKLKIVTMSVERFSDLLHQEDWGYWESRLPTIQIPTLILWGEKDHLFRGDEPKRFSEVLPKSDLRIVLGGAHNMSRGAPDTVSREIRRFLRPPSTVQSLDN